MDPADPQLPERIGRIFTQLGIPPTVVAGRTRGPYAECDDLVPVGPDALGRESRLERATAGRWQTMTASAQQHGVSLLQVSAFRSYDYQASIFTRKFAAGQTLDQILRVNALPGYSEHHTGRAIDIGTPGCPHLTEGFADTAAFRWLTEHAGRFGFVLSYPRNNPHGVAFEPWHWCQQAG